MNANVGCCRSMYVPGRCARALKAEYASSSAKTATHLGPPKQQQAPYQSEFFCQPSETKPCITVQGLSMWLWIEVLSRAWVVCWWDFSIRKQFSHRNKGTAPALNPKSLKSYKQSSSLKVVRISLLALGLRTHSCVIVPRIKQTAM